LVHVCGVCSLGAGAMSRRETGARLPAATPALHARRRSRHNRLGPECFPKCAIKGARRERYRTIQSTRQ
jgi:hypothetical protein